MASVSATAGTTAATSASVLAPVGTTAIASAMFSQNNVVGGAPGCVVRGIVVIVVSGRIIIIIVAFGIVIMVAFIGRMIVGRGLTSSNAE